MQAEQGAFPDTLTLFTQVISVFSTVLTSEGDRDFLPDSGERRIKQFIRNTLPAVCVPAHGFIWGCVGCPGQTYGGGDEEGELTPHGGLFLGGCGRVKWPGAGGIAHQTMLQHVAEWLLALKFLSSPLFQDQPLIISLYHIEKRFLVS
ncbi:unnamed protein product [Knipowitschia caucasica]